MPSHNNRERLQRSNRRNPCPICRKYGCGQSAEGLVLCWRVASDKQALSGAWIHSEGSSKAAVTLPASVEPTLASIERRHNVYSALLANLTLSTAHANHLGKVRQLSPETIQRAGFATVPSRTEGDELAATLSWRFALNGVPGFFRWQASDEWKFRFSGERGFFIPIRNQRGQIEALQIRCDTEAKDRRYLLVSGAPDKARDGRSSGAPAHFIRGAGSYGIVTEGALKAQVISEQLQVPVIGLVGVGTFDDSFGERLRKAVPQIKKIGVAFDWDWRTNDKVRFQMKRLLTVLRAANYTANVITWDEGEGKGFDDVLLGKAVR